MKTIIAVCSTTGPQSGKSTYLETVVKKLLPDAAHLRFSDPIVNYLTILGPMLGHDQSYETLKQIEVLPGITGRDVMLAMGESLRNTLRPSFYAEVFAARMKRVDSEYIILDDLRKIPELEALVKSGADVLIVNVLKPHKHSHDCARHFDPCPQFDGTNDCEFNRYELAERIAKRRNPGIRYMEVTWTENGLFKRVN